MYVRLCSSGGPNVQEMSRVLTADECVALIALLRQAAGGDNPLFVPEQMGIMQRFVSPFSGPTNWICAQRQSTDHSAREESVGDRQSGHERSAQSGADRACRQAQFTEDVAYVSNFFA
jgi:hypothetical protein